MVVAADVQKDRADHDVEGLAEHLDQGVDEGTLRAGGQAAHDEDVAGPLAEGPPRPGVLLDKIVAVVNDGVVLQSELDRQTNTIIERLRQQGTPLPPEDLLESQILERLVNTRIQLQRAERLVSGLCYSVRCGVGGGVAQ